MSYMEPRAAAPFGAITLYRAGSALSDAIELLTGGRRATPLARLSPAEMEDLGLSIADLPSGRSDIVGRIAAVYRAWNARRRTIAELSRLSDAQLDDIGLTRWHVEELRAGRPSF
jgi:uncharacterized protein YjiS (DUF1127 family)